MVVRLLARPAARSFSRCHYPSLQQARGFKPGRGPNPGYSPADNRRDRMQWVLVMAFGTALPIFGILYPLFDLYNKDKDDYKGRNIEHHTGHFPHLQGPKY